MSFREQKMSEVRSKVVVQPFGARQQAIVSFRDTHIIIGKPTIHDTVTELSPPSDLLLAALASDCSFSCQAAARQLNILLNHLTTTARWIDTEAHEPEAPHVSIRMSLIGPDRQQSETLIEAIKQTCQTYRLLAPVMFIKLEVIL
jgi:uncharacterized OsmC-like protein